MGTSQLTDIVLLSNNETSNAIIKTENNYVTCGLKKLLVRNQLFLAKFVIAAEITQCLEVNTHFKVDEKNKNVILFNRVG